MSEDIKSGPARIATPGQEPDRNVSDRQSVAGGNFSVPARAIWNLPKSLRDFDYI